jgi:hypothetical protein
MVASPEILNQGYAEAEREKTRQQLRQQVGNSDVINGTTNDIASLLLFFLARLTVLLANSNDYESFKTALRASDLFPVTQQFLTEIQAGTVKLPPITKGQTEVIAEIKDRLTKISQVFE